MNGNQNMATFRQTVANRLSMHGDPVSPDDIVFDKSGVTTRQRQDAQAKADQANTYVKKAYAAMQGTDPAAQKDAVHVFQTFGIDPTMPMKQSLSVVANKFKRGDF